MRYWGPINSTNGIHGNDGYVDGNPQTGIQGSIPTFRTFEQMMRELQNVVVAADLTPDDAMDGEQVGQAIQSGALIFAEDTGSADALLVALDPIPPTYHDGMIVTIRKNTLGNATTVPTLNVNGIAARTMTRSDGSVLAIGDLSGSSTFQVAWDEDDQEWRVITFTPNMARSILFAPTVVIYSSGSGSFVVPENIFKLEYEVIGGGGGGGFALTGGAAAGGYGAHTVRGTYSVTPGQSVSYAVGAGGAAGSDGSPSSFGTVVAAAGSGSPQAGIDSPGSPALGIAGSVGDLDYIGQQGEAGFVDVGGTFPVWGGHGGYSVGGGTGGNGSRGGGNANPGTAPGGGGGGGANTFAPGAGAAGRVMLRY